ncbi:MAG: HAMP domain-containing sensor histidine kinase [Parvularculaceae bacterium]
MSSTSPTAASEKELKERNALLEDIDRQKSKFVDHVSYHLRTPLSSIIGFAEMIDGQMFGVLNDRQKDYIASILSASYHLRDLITDIIDLAAVDAGQVSLDVADIDIRELLTSAATYSALKAEDTQVALAVECDKDIGAIRADPRRLKQILFNLLSNAFAYTGVGGKVTIGADRAPGLIRLWVGDSGRGVSTKDQARVFEPFESSGPSAGAGLGLSLVQRLVSLHGGWVRMESAPDSGTRITCFLPAEPRSIEIPPEATENIIVTKPARREKTAKDGGEKRAKRPARRRAPRAEAAE